MDLTADGTPDNLSVTASGQRIDSLRIVLEIRVGEDVAFSEQWWSALYFVYVPLTQFDSAGAHDRVFRHLREVLADRNFAELDTTVAPWGVPPADGVEPREHIAWDLTYTRLRDSLLRSGLTEQQAERSALDAMTSRAVDSAEVRRIWDDMERRRPTTFRFFSGGEHVRKIAWSERQRRFFVIHSCC